MNIKKVILLAGAATAVTAGRQGHRAHAPHAMGGIVTPLTEKPRKTSTRLATPALASLQENSR